MCRGASKLLPGPSVGGRRPAAPVPKVTSSARLGADPPPLSAGNRLTAVLAGADSSSSGQPSEASRASDTIGQSGFCCFQQIAVNKSPPARRLYSLRALAPNWRKSTRRCLESIRMQDFSQPASQPGSLQLARSLARPPRTRQMLAQPQTGSHNERSRPAEDFRYWLPSSDRRFNRRPQSL